MPIADKNPDTSSKPRARLSFDDISERQKRRRVQSLRKSNLTEELAYATQLNLRQEGKNYAAHVIKTTALGSPAKGSKYRESIKLLDVEEKNFTPDQALSIYIEISFCRNKYQQLPNACMAQLSKLFSSVKKLNKARKECHTTERITVSKDSAEIKVQILLHHTVERIIKSQADVIDCLSEEQLQDLTLFGKWGLDGSFGHRIYKQELDFDKSDGNLFLLLS